MKIVDGKVQANDAKLSNLRDIESVSNEIEKALRKAQSAKSKATTSGSKREMNRAINMLKKASAAVEEAIFEQEIDTE